MYHNVESSFSSPLPTLAMAYRLAGMRWDTRSAEPVKRRIRTLVDRLGLASHQTLVEKYEAFRIGVDTSFGEVGHYVVKNLAQGQNITVRLTQPEEAGKAGGLSMYMFRPTDEVMKAAEKFVYMGAQLRPYTQAEVISRWPSVREPITGMYYGGGFRIALERLHSLPNGTGCMDMIVEGCLNDESPRMIGHESVPQERFMVEMPLVRDGGRVIIKRDGQRSVLQRVISRYIDQHYVPVVRGLLYAGATTLFEPMAAQIEGIWSVREKDGVCQDFGYAIDLEGGWTLAQASGGKYRRVPSREYVDSDQLYALTKGFLGKDEAERVRDEYAALVFRESVVGIDG